MEVRVRALDRVLRAKQIWVPNWYSGKYLVAYWDVFGRPEEQAALRPRRQPPGGSTRRSTTSSKAEGALR